MIHRRMKHLEKIQHIVFQTFFILCISSMVISADAVSAVGEPGLLFILSGDNGFSADFASGSSGPAFLEDIEIIPDGASGKGFRCPHFKQVFAFNAPGNIYAQRGTLAFFFRARDPLGKVPFKIFQVSYSEHTSFDMVWLRIDYNGHGFDAFVTDVNLARTRVSFSPPSLPAPEKWTHLAVAWDETQGIRFYMDGELVARKDTTAVYDAGLAYFGTHGYLINPLSVSYGSSDIRSGDFDEFRIYDHMLDPEDISWLARCESPENIKPVVRDLNDPVTRDEWRLRYGWNREGDYPPYLPGRSTAIRTVGILDAYDHKQWFWKACDGIRETTWPGVYNRSSLPGRKDYFIMPDWNCYSVSGKTVTFTMPAEKWNYLEITGAAFGSADLLIFDKEASADQTVHLFDRPEHQERTFNRFEEPNEGGKVRFTNTVQETPIGEFMPYYVAPGSVPKESVQLTYTVTGKAKPDYPCLDSLVAYIEGRFPPDERTVMVALPGGAPRVRKPADTSHALPVVHVLIPSDFRVTRPDRTRSQYSYTWENLRGGLDGIAVDFPALDVKPTHGSYFPLNIRISDPLWPQRALLDFSFSVRPKEAKTLWLDTRDRILPNGYSFFITIAGAGGDFSAASLEGARIRLVFKDRSKAVAEHEIDRFTQVKDNYGNIVESRPNTKDLGLFDRYWRDITDLLRIDPDHNPGIYYWSFTNPEQGWPPFRQPEPPQGTPLWAFRQVEYLKLFGQVFLWWIDNRQIESGEFGGGLSDDSDMTNMWPVPALCGIEPEKITDSLHRELEAIYANGMLTNGLNTMMADGLHTTEEGTNVMGTLMLLEYGDPKLLERVMETSRAYERVTGINRAGHRHWRSGYFSATEVAQEGVWLWSMFQTFRLLHPGVNLVEFNGNPRAKKLLIEMADGLIAHRKKGPDGRYYTPGVVNFETDEDRPSDFGAADHLLWGAWCWTHNPKYLQPLLDPGVGSLGRLNANVIDILGKRDTWGSEIASTATPYSGGDFARHVAWQVTGNRQYLEEIYAEHIREHSQHMYLNTEAHFWTDRLNLGDTELQRERLGGVARRGKSYIYPGQVVSWTFREPAVYKDVAILIPQSTSSEFTVIAYNLSAAPVTASMTGWMVDPGTWELIQGIDRDSDDSIDTVTDRRMVAFERTKSIDLVFEPRVQTIVKLTLKKKGKPYWERPDLGIGSYDIIRTGDTVTVTVHSLGSVDAPESPVAILDRAGRTIATAVIPSIEAPVDLFPRTARVALRVPAGTSLDGCLVCVDPAEKLTEITRVNNVVRMK